MRVGDIAVEISLAITKLRSAAPFVLILLDHAKKNIIFKPNQQLTLFEVTNNVIPTGRKTIPTRKKTGSTVLAVKTGCHAFIRCCLNGESKRE